jgi:hypothetical protein
MLRMCDIYSFNYKSKVSGLLSALFYLKSNKIATMYHIQAIKGCVCVCVCVCMCVYVCKNECNEEPLTFFCRDQIHGFIECLSTIYPSFSCHIFLLESCYP